MCLFRRPGFDEKRNLFTDSGSEVSLFKNGGGGHSATTLLFREALYMPNRYNIIINYNKHL